MIKIFQFLSGMRQNENKHATRIYYITFNSFLGCDLRRICKTKLQSKIYLSIPFWDATVLEFVRLIGFLMAFNSFLGCDISNTNVFNSKKLNDFQFLSGMRRVRHPLFPKYNNTFNSFLGCDIVWRKFSSSPWNKLSIPFWDATKDSSMVLWYAWLTFNSFLGCDTVWRGPLRGPPLSLSIPFWDATFVVFKSYYVTRLYFQFLSGMRQCLLFTPYITLQGTLI